MTGEVQEYNVFNLGICRAKVRGAGSLVDCLASKQAGFCKFSLSFGNGYFCKHPRRDEIIDDTEKIKKRARATTRCFEIR